MTKCTVCNRTHNHLSCSYCGAIKLGARTYDIANMRQLVSGIAHMREPKLVSFASKSVVKNLTARLVMRSS